MCFNGICQHLRITGFRSAHGTRSQNIAARNPISHVERKRFSNYIEVIRCPECAWLVPHGSCCHWGPSGCQAVFQISVPDLNKQHEIERLPFGPGLRFLVLIRMYPHFGERDSNISRLAKMVDMLNIRLAEEEESHGTKKKELEEKRRADE